MKITMEGINKLIKELNSITGDSYYLERSLTEPGKYNLDTVRRMIFPGATLLEMHNQVMDMLHREGITWDVMVDPMNFSRSEIEKDHKRVLFKWEQLWYGDNVHQKIIDEVNMQYLFENYTEEIEGVVVAPDSWHDFELVIDLYDEEECFTEAAQIIDDLEQINEISVLDDNAYYSKVREEQTEKAWEFVHWKFPFLPKSNQKKVVDYILRHNDLDYYGLDQCYYAIETRIAPTIPKHLLLYFRKKVTGKKTITRDLFEGMYPIKVIRIPGYIRKYVYKTEVQND